MSVPPEKEVKDFRFNQLLKIRVGALPDDVTKSRVSLLATSNKYGLAFIGTASGFRVLRTNNLIAKAAEAGKATTTVVEDFGFWKTIQLPGAPMFIGLSSDSLTLAVCIEKNGWPVALMYDVRIFADQNAAVAPFLEVKLSGSPHAHLLDAMWNPGNDYPSLFATVVSDGSMALWDIKTSLTCVASVPMTADVTCLCWSPKGKQLLAGRKDGGFVQYDQGLKEKKKVPPPPGLFNGKAVSVLDVIWESTYVYVAAYVPTQNPDAEQPSLVTVSCPKASPVSYVNFEDVCFGGGTERMHKYYFSMLAEWKIIVAASANSLEAAILGKSLANEALWERWSLEDSGRAELPMTADYVETFPVGMVIDVTSQKPVSLGDNQSHVASPIFMLLSTEGVLSTFHMIDSRPGTPSLQKQVETLQNTGARMPLVMPQAATQQAAQTPSQPAAQSVTQTAAQSAAPQPAQPVAKPAAAAVSQMGAGPTQDATPQTAPGAPSLASTPKPSALFGLLNQGDGTKSLFGQSAAASKNELGASGALSFAQKAASETEGQKSGGMLFGIESKGDVFGAQAQAQGLFSQSSQSSGAKSSLLGLPSNAGGFNFMSTASQKADEKPTRAVPATPQTMIQGQKPASGFLPAEAGTQKPAPAFSSTLQTPGVSTQNVPIQKPSPSVAQPSSFSFALTPQKPTVEVTGSVAPKPAGVTKAEPAGQVGRNVGFTPVNGTVRTPASAFTFSGVKGDDMSSAKAHSAATSQQPAQQTTPIKVSVNNDNATKTTGSGRKRGHVLEDPFTKTILEEMQHFRQELRDLKTRCASVDFEIGDREEITQLRKDTDDMSQFCEEIKATTQSTNEDIHELKLQCLESFATLEECHKRQRCYQDDGYRFLLASRALDPMSERKMREIQTHYQYLDAGIRDVDLKLDTEWAAYQRGKNGSKSLQTPATDMIYRTLTNNKKTVDTYSHTLGALTSQLASLRMYNTTNQWTSARHGQSPRRLAPAEALSGGRLAQEIPSALYSPRTLGQRANKLSHINRNGLSESNLNGSVSPQKCISPEKQHKLQQELGQRRITRVKATAPGNLTMSRMLSAERMREIAQQQQSLQESYLDSSTDPDSSGSRTTASTSPLKQTTARQAAAPSSGNQSKNATAVKSPAIPPISGFNFSAQPSAATQFGIQKDSQATSLFGNVSGFSFSSPKSTAFTSVVKTTTAGDQPKSKSVTMATASSSQNAHKLGLVTSQTAMTSKGDVKKAPPSAGFSFALSSNSTQNTGFSFSTQGKGKLNLGQGSQSGFSFDTKSSKSDAPSLLTSLVTAQNDGVVKSDGSVTSSGSDSTKSDSSEVSSATTASSDALQASTGSETLNETVKGPRTPPPDDACAESGIDKTPVRGEGRPLATSGQAAAEFTFTSSQSTKSSSVFAFGSDKGGDAKTFGSGQNAKASASATTASSVPSFAFGSSLSSSGVFGGSGFSLGGGGALSEGTATTDTSSAGGVFGFGGGTSTTGTSSAGGVFGFGGGTATTSTSSTTSGVMTTSMSSTAGAFGLNSTGLSSAASAFSFGSSKSSLGGSGETSTESASAPDARVSSKETVAASGAVVAPATTTTAPSVFGAMDSKVTAQAAAAIIPAESPAPSSAKTVADTSVSSTSGGSASAAAPTTAASLTPQTAAPSGSQAAAAGSSLKGLLGDAPISGTKTAPPTVSTEAAQSTQSKAESQQSVPSTQPADQNTQSPQKVLSSEAITSTKNTVNMADTQNNSSISAPSTVTTAPVSSIQSTEVKAEHPAQAVSNKVSEAGKASTAGDTLAVQTSTVTTPAAGEAAVSSSSASGFGVTSSGFAAATNTTSAAGGAPGFGTATTSQSVFGTQTTAAPVFGTASSNSGSASVFGGTATTTASGLFGSAPTTETTSQPFGQPASTQPAPMFGQTDVTSGGFGGGGASSVFGTPSASAAPGLFGRPASTPAAFGGFGQQSAFGQTTAASPLFGQQGGTTGSVFGGGGGQQAAGGGSGGLFSSSSGGSGLFAGLGGKPSAENANKNVFGGGTFGASPATSQPGLFGSGGGVFGATPSSGGGFASPGGGGFSSGGGGVGSTGFGGFGGPPQSPQNTGGFGGKATFGSSPAFGGSPAFGSAPAFGSPPGMGGTTFGGGAVFGSGTNPQTTSAGFAGFASAEAPSFGGIAQQSNTPTFGGLSQQPPNTGFGSSAGFGGSGFGNTNQNSSFGQGGSFSSYRG